MTKHDRPQRGVTARETLNELFPKFGTVFPKRKASWAEIRAYCTKKFKGNPTTLFNTLKSMTTNAGARKGNKRAKPKIIEDFFFQEEDGAFRKYKPDQDQKPLYYDGRHGSGDRAAKAKTKTAKSKADQPDTTA